MCYIRFNNKSSTEKKQKGAMEMKYMTAIEFNTKVAEAFKKWYDDEDLSWDNEYIGIRYEDLDREVGDELEWSKDNPDREDERDFPKYGTAEYDELPELDGTSVWSLESKEDARNYTLKENETTSIFLRKHAYVVIGSESGHHECPDDGEILIKDAKVFAKIF